MILSFMHSVSDWLKISVCRTLRHLCPAPSGSSLSCYHTHMKYTAATLMHLHILHSMEYSN